VGAETMAKGVTAKLADVDVQRKEGEARRQVEVQRFDAMAAEIAKQKTPVDADLAARRTAATQAQRAVDEAKQRIARIIATQKALDEAGKRPPAPGAPAQDAAQKAAAAGAQREALAREKDEVERGLGPMNETAANIAADVERLRVQSQELQTQIDRVAAQHRQALGEIDQALAATRRAADTTRAEGRTVAGQQETHFAELGARLLASGIDAPPLADAVAAVRATDETRRTITAQIDSLVAESKAMPRGTMPKFYGMAAIAVIVIVLLAGGRRGVVPEYTPSVPLARDPVRGRVVPDKPTTIELVGVAVVTSEADYAGPYEVTVSATTSGETADAFRHTARIYSPGPRLPYEVRINTGNVLPGRSLVVRLMIPRSFVSAQPRDYEIRALAQIFEDGDEDILDSFELMDGALDPDNKWIEVKLGRDEFTNRRDKTKTFEAVVTLASIRTKPPGRARSQRPGMNASVSVAAVVLDWIKDILENKPPCERKPCDLSSPLTPLKPPTSHFNPGKKHMGTDYPVEGPHTGSSVHQAVSPIASGIVIAVDWDQRDLAEPDPRSGLKIKGWGRYVLIEHCDGTMSVYAHLVKESTDHLKLGQRVSTTDIIGLSDNSGGSKGPHLHVEYYTPGKKKKTYVDPDWCLVHLR